MQQISVTELIRRPIVTIAAKETENRYRYRDIQSDNRIPNRLENTTEINSLPKRLETPTLTHDCLKYSLLYATARVSVSTIG